MTTYIAVRDQELEGELVEPKPCASSWEYFLHMHNPITHTSQLQPTTMRTSLAGRTATHNLSMGQLKQTKTNCLGCSFGSPC
jgi:hypothetical protein